MLATSYQQTPDADWTFNLFGFSDNYGLLTWAIVMRRKCMETGRKLPGDNENRQRRSDMKETDTIAPKGDIQGSIMRALPDMQINLKGGK